MNDLTPEDAALVEMVRARWQHAEDEHKQFRDHASEFYALYSGFQDFRERAGIERDRDVVVDAAKREWGAELFIPYCFSTVETILPRMVSSRPRMLVLPRDEESLGNVDNMRLIIDAQQEQARYEATLQDVAKDGLIYGIGVQKVGWRKEYRQVKGIQPSTYDPDRFVEKPAGQECIVDDAWAWRVDPFDFFWDPYADSIDGCEFVIHRAWRSARYVQRMVERQQWRGDWPLEELLSGSGTSKRDEVWDARMRADGYNTNRARGDHLHEVWEFHDGDQVVTILDGQYPVQSGESPGPAGVLPFQVYRPTKVPGRMVGRGEIEPIKHLQYEINTLRSQRRDAATLAIMKTFAFDESVVDADDLVFGPGLAIPVNGNPRDFLFPIPVGDLPGSSFSEEQAIQGDLDRTSGISDAVTGATGSGGAAETATGVQLVQAAAGKRIENKLRRLEMETIIPGCDYWIGLNQLHILEKRDVPVPQEGHVPAHQFVQLGPNELRGRMAASLEGGATAPENTPQMRQDAQMFMGLLQVPEINKQRVLEKVLELSGVKHPESWVAAAPQVGIDVIQQWMQANGLPPEALQSLQQFVQEGPPEGADDGPPQQSEEK